RVAIDDQWRYFSSVCSSIRLKQRAADNRRACRGKEFATRQTSIEHLTVLRSAYRWEKLTETRRYRRYPALTRAAISAAACSQTLFRSIRCPILVCRVLPASRRHT